MNDVIDDIATGISQEELLAALTNRFSDTDDQALLDAMIHDIFPNEIVISSSFGAEAAVLLQMVADVDKNAPIFFLNTGHLFPETIAYRETIAEYFGLTNILNIHPDPVHIENADSEGTLWQRDHDYCCHLRKVLPLMEARTPYKAWVTGRKRFQSETRSVLEKIELDKEGRIKINPLFNWTHDRVVSQFTKFDLPKHPLVSKGYPSIGCLHCTNAVKEGEDVRSGRWTGSGKTECGIHS